MFRVPPFQIHPGSSEANSARKATRHAPWAHVADFGKRWISWSLVVLVYATYHVLTARGERDEQASRLFRLFRHLSHAHLDLCRTWSCVFSFTLSMRDEPMPSRAGLLGSQRIPIQIHSIWLKPRAQYRWIKEYGLNYIGLHIMI